MVICWPFFDGRVNDVAPQDGARMRVHGGEPNNLSGVVHDCVSRAECEAIDDRN